MTAGRLEPQKNHDALLTAFAALRREEPRDPRVPVEGGRMLPGTGAIAAALSYASGVRPEVVGKPARVFFETALRRFGATADRSVIVGDTLDSDIAGGAAVGMRTVLVGEASPSTLDPAPVPDHRAGGLREVWELFER